MNSNNQTSEARRLAMLALTGAGLYLCWLMLRPFVNVLEWAIVLVIIFHPIHKLISRRTDHRGLSAFLSCFLVLLVVVGPLFLITMAVGQELSKILPRLPNTVTQLMQPESLLGRVAGWLETRFGIGAVRWQDFLVEQLKLTSEMVIGFSWSLVSNVAGFIIKAFFVVFTMYYLFRDTDKILEKLPDALPVSAEQSRAIISRTQEVVSASVYGVVTIASIQGLLGGFAFWILGVPSPVLWAVLMAFVCMIPIAGSFLVWLPLSLFLLVQGHWTKGLFLIAWGTLVVSLVDNFLRPRLLRNQTKLHELFIFFSVLGGIGVFGLLGIVLGPVVLAITLGLLHTFSTPKSLATE